MLTSAPQRAMSVDTNSTNSNETNRCSNISDESGPITAPPAPISSSSSEHDNHEGGTWSSDYSNSEDEYPNVEETEPVSVDKISFQTTFSCSFSVYPKFKKKEKTPNLIKIPNYCVNYFTLLIYIFCC